MYGSVRAERLALTRPGPGRTIRRDAFDLLGCYPRLWTFDRSDVERQADWCEHVGQRVEAELADLSVQEVRQLSLL
jgi:hypothetical protein